MTLIHKYDWEWVFLQRLFVKSYFDVGVRMIFMHNKPESLRLKT